MRALKVQYLLITADLVGGTEQAIIHQANALARRGHSVEILSVYRDRDRPHFHIHKDVRVTYAVDRRQDRVRPHRRVPISPTDAVALMEEPSCVVPPSWDRQFNALCDRSLQPLLLSSKSDVVVAPTPPLAAYAAHYVLDSVIVQQEHRPTGYRAGSAFARIQSFAGRIDALVSLTERSTGWLGENLTGRQPLLLTIPNMNPDGFYPQSSCTSPVVIAAGRLAAQKRFDHLVEAFSLVADEFPDWSLRIFGEGPLRRRTQSAIEGLGLYDRVSILPYVSDLRLEMSKASIAAMTSVFEGLPLVGLEAVATGLPFISYDIPTGPAEIIQDGINGLLVAPEDIPGFADGLRQLMGDPTRRIQMGAMARESASRYSEATVTDQWEELFQHLTGRSRSAAIMAASAIQPRQEPAVEGKPLCPSTTAERTLRSVIDSFARNDIEWAPVSGYSSSHTVAVRDTDLGAVATALSTVEDDLVARLTVPGTPGHRWCEGSSSVAQMLPLTRPTVVGLVVGESMEDVRVSDPGCLVEVEVWRSGLDGVYSCPRHNRSHSEVEWSHFKTRQVENLADYDDELATLWSTPDFPVDVVYMWVDGNDPQWQARRRTFSGDAANYHVEAVDDTRFIDREELRYSLRSLLAFAPWVNKIYLVTDRQQPSWLDLADDRLKIVDHTEIFPDPSQLPTFNSHAIEATLHRIPGLSEHFIVMNDDVILKRSVTKNQFFSSAGQARFFLSPVKINDLDESPPHIRAAQNNRRLIETKFQKRVTQCFLHTPHPQRRSVLEQIEEEFAEEIRATRGSRFRNDHDVSLCSSLAQYYGYLTGKYVEGNVRYAYLQLNSSTTMKRMEAIRTNDNLDCFAIGENSGTDEFHDTNSELSEFLGSLLPWRSSYEK